LVTQHDSAMTEEEAAIVALVREFVDREVRPVARELEHANTYPEKLVEQMKEMGVFGLAVPEPWGAAQVSAQCYAAVTEELARGWMSLAGAMGGHTVVAKLLVDFGTRAQQDRYLPRMATGQLRATMALTEPGGGSDLQAIRTTARRDGESYVVNGSKTWISNARRSGLVALLCKTDPAARPPHTGISILLVEQGFHVSRDLPKLGYKGVESCELSFADVRVPADALLGEEEGRGFAQMMRGLEIGRIQVACRALGVGRAALEDSLRYAQERESFGKTDLAAPVGRQLPGRHGDEAGGRAAADALRRPPLRLGRTRGPGSRDGETVRLRDRDGGGTERGTHSRRLRLLDGVRRGALLP
jgi:alkylation response protein AidB-like acyl-CoA dehydrogenase